MGSVRITETSKAGETSSTIEYEFSDSVDFLAWEADKVERLNQAVKSLYGTFGDVETSPTEPMSFTAEVKKKETKH